MPDFSSANKSNLIDYDSNRFVNEDYNRIEQSASDFDRNRSNSIQIEINNELLRNEETNNENIFVRPISNLIELMQNYSNSWPSIITKSLPPSSNGMVAIKNQSQSYDEIIDANKCSNRSLQFLPSNDLSNHLAGNYFEQKHLNFDMASSGVDGIEQIRKISQQFSLRSNKKLPVSERISILGKPLPARKEMRFFRERILVYNFLQRPKGFWTISYHVFVLFIILFGLILFALSTVDHYHQQSIIILRWFDTFILAVLVGEFLARAWSSSCIGKYQGWSGFFCFITSTFRLIDLFVIISSGVVLWIHHIDDTNRRNVDWLRFAQAFQVLRASQRFRPWRIMASVIWTQRDHLAIAVYMCSLSLIFITFTVYFFEHNQPNTDFTSIPKTFWWGIVSLLTIGYGDMVPTTTAGKIMASVLLLLCFSAFTLPAGILGTGLALKVQEQQRQKHFNKRRAPAAQLIQCAWRCYASSINSRSIATWKVCVPRGNNFASDGKLNNQLTNNVFANFNENTQSNYLKIKKSNRIANANHSSLLEFGHLVPPTLKPFDSKQKKSNQNFLRSISLNGINNCYHFTAQEKIAIRFVRILKFEVARKKFKNAFRPYNINDVIEQYAAGHADVVSRVKNMHSKINAIQGSMTSVIKMCEELHYLHLHHVDRLERTIDRINEKIDVNRKNFLTNLEPNQLSNDSLTICNSLSARSSLSASTSILGQCPKLAASSDQTISRSSIRSMNDQPRRFKSRRNSQ
ncbi:kinetochore protein NDC80 [Sarcoptes scabiei]|nr:kinetochore protein NDC80 [Sarcoptes scabiei]